MGTFIAERFDAGEIAQWLIQFFQYDTTLMMTEQNAECQSLVQCADDLTQLIQHNVVSVSNKLFTKGLVAKDVYDSVLSIDGTSSQFKASKLLSCVLDKLEHSPGKFQEFIDVLSDGSSFFDDVVSKIKEFHGKHSNRLNR